MAKGAQKYNFKNVRNFGTRNWVYLGFISERFLIVVCMCLG